MTLDEVTRIATDIGLQLDLTSRASSKGDLFVVSVERPARAGDWSLERTEIAIARSVPDVVAHARAALERMAPQLRKKLAQLPSDEEPQELPIAAGVSSDGIVSTLRVERDGTVRLAPEDIAAIAEAVYRRLHPRAKA